MVHDFTKEHSLVSQYIAEIRDQEIQKDSHRFRTNVRRLGEIMAYEISKELEWKTEMVETPLGEAECQVLAEQPVLATILRAGLTLHQGMHQFYDRADNAFVSCYRKERGGDIEVELEYVTCPDLTDRVLIITDPMLATGLSMVNTLEQLGQYGSAETVHIVVLIASEPGIQKVEEKFPNAHIWAGAVDSELDDNAFIVPGLGDAGDLSFGSKLQS